MSNTQKITIIGGGPSGLSAALYLARAGFSPLVIAGSPPGGQLTLTTEVENYPGVPKIMGPELVLKMREQAQSFGAVMNDANVVSVELDAKIKILTLEDGSKIETEVLVIATGAKALWLGLPQENTYKGKGVSACATCDGFFFRNKEIAVVGGGDTAMEEALTLTNFGSKVYVIHRKDSFRASKIMADRVLNHPKIEVIWNSEVSDIKGATLVESISITSSKTGEVRVLPVSALFVAIGHKPDTEIFKDKVAFDEKGYILTYQSAAALYSKLDPGSAQGLILKNFPNSYLSGTSTEGVFAGGDCVDSVYRQAVTAAGMGVAAALDAQRYLELQH